METILPVLPTLLVSSLYWFWQAYQRERLRQRQRLLSERLTYMLWVMANRVDEPGQNSGQSPAVLSGS